jgi:iron complex outermembrane receptor protein
MVNSAMPVGQNSELYAFGGRNFRDTDAYAFTRGSFANGDNRAVPSLYPDGLLLELHPTSQMYQPQRV